MLGDAVRLLHLRWERVFNILENCLYVIMRGRAVTSHKSSDKKDQASREKRERDFHWSYDVTSMTRETDRISVTPLVQYTNTGVCLYIKELRMATQEVGSGATKNFSYRESTTHHRLVRARADLLLYVSN